MADDAGPQSGMAGAELARQELERENRILERKMRRLEASVKNLESFQDSNSTLLSSLIRELEDERAKSRRLLLNVLPARIADRLTAGEARIADRHEDVTVLFSDFVSFTTIAGERSPSVLVEELNELFRAFDAICDETEIEKIKTVGDAYLAVGGLSGAGRASAGDAATRVADAALRMAAYVAERGESIGRNHGSGHAGRGTPWRIRIGINAGPVVAGVVGASKFAYDVWGDTVNVASRLETTAEAGRIHVSETAAEKLRAEFVLEPRGAIELKGKGPVETYWLVGRRSG